MSKKLRDRVKHMKIVTKCCVAIHFAMHCLLRKWKIRIWRDILVLWLTF